MRKDLKLIIALLAAGIAVISAVTFGSALHKVFTLDEVEEARMAEKINSMGPKTFLPASEGGADEDLSHPLLYSYTNAVFYRLFGSSEPAFRSYGLFFYCLSLLILILLIRLFFSKDHFRAALAIAVSLYLINPLLIQHSLLLNADNNISAFAIILYVYLFCLFEIKEKPGFVPSRLILALCVAFNFMCKEVTPCFLMFSVCVYRVMNREWRKLAADAVLNIGLGLAIFWGIWWAYCAASGTDIMAFIKFTAQRKSKKVMSIGFFMNQSRYFFMIWKWPIYWASAPFFILVFMSLAARARDFVREKILRPVDLIGISSMVMFAPFIFVKPSVDMMKYQYPDYPLFIFMIAWLVVPMLRQVPRNAENKIAVPAVIYAAAVVFAAGTLWYYKLGDYITGLWMQLPPGFYLKYYSPILLAVGLSLLLKRHLGWYRAVALGLLVSIYPVNAGLNINQTRDYTTAECWMNYGEQGLKDTAAYLREHADKRWVIAARKDIEYYLNYRFRMGLKNTEPTYVFLTRTSEDLEKFFQTTPIQYFVFDRISSIQRANPDVMKILGKYFLVEKRFGDFVVLRSKLSVLAEQKAKK